MTLIYVFVGGGFGSIVRFLISKIFNNKGFPISTLLSNILSVIILAVVIYLFKDKLSNTNLKSMITIGFCGGFSTMSTFSYESYILLKSGNFLLFSLNIILTIVITLLIFYLFDFYGDKVL